MRAKCFVCDTCESETCVKFINLIEDPNSVFNSSENHECADTGQKTNWQPTAEYELVKKQPTLVSAECRAEVRRLIVEFEDNLRIALAESRKKWRVGSGARCSDLCGFCNIFAGMDALGIPETCNEVCGVLFWRNEKQKRCNPCTKTLYESPIGLLEHDGGKDWPEACRIMQAEFDRIEREFLG